MTIEVLVGIVISATTISVLLYAAVRYRNKVRNKLYAKQNYEWDNPRDFYLDQSRMKELYDTYQFMNHEKDTIDDITWNDLEMDGVFCRVNYTKTTMGEVYLYNSLRNPLKNLSELQERDELIELFTNERDLCNKKRAELEKIGNRLHFSIFEYKDIFENENLINIIPSIALVALQILSFFSFFVNPYIGIVCVGLTLIFNIFIYYRSRAKIERYLPFINQITSMLERTKALSIDSGNPRLDQYLSQLKLSRKIYKKYRKLAQLVSFRINNRTTELDAFFDYIRCVFHVDLFAFYKLNKFMIRDMDIIINCYHIIGYLDAMISIAYFRNYLSLSYSNYGYCKPQFIGESLTIDGLYHPLLDYPVENSFHTKRSMLITGSNATGKSTFLRTVAMNAILAQTIYTVCARSYQAPFFHVMTSMIIKDNIYTNDSYFMIEIKSIKRILDANKRDLKMLCCIDEVLKGTNTVERIGAAAEILKSISESNTICLAASHDVELTSILNQYYDNYHFQESITSEGLECDYVLYKGETKSRNAIDLLKLIGFSEEIVRNAKYKVNHYLESGEWIEMICR